MLKKISVVVFVLLLGGCSNPFSPSTLPKGPAEGYIAAKIASFGVADQTPVGQRPAPGGLNLDVYALAKGQSANLRVCLKTQGYKGRKLSILMAYGESILNEFFDEDGMADFCRTLSINANFLPATATVYVGESDGDVPSAVDLYGYVYLDPK